MADVYNDDLIELRKKFAFVDKKDPKALLHWFKSRPHLGTNDHAQIADRSAKYFRELRKVAGISGKMPANLPKNKSIRKVVNITPPEN